MAHLLPEGIKTNFFKELDNGHILILPRNAEEFQDMLELVLYNPSAYTFHHRFREAMVKLQEPNYNYLEQSKINISFLTLFPQIIILIFFKVMDNLVNDKHAKDAEVVKQLARNITTPTLVLWGTDDKVRDRGAKHT